METQHGEVNQTSIVIGATTEGFVVITYGCAYGGQDEKESFVLTPEDARNLAKTLNEMADDAEKMLGVTGPEAQA